MHGYEIRIIARNYKTSKAYQIYQSNSAAAIRRAAELKLEGQGVEVWDGMDCIYANYREQPLWAS